MQKYIYNIEWYTKERKERKKRKKEKEVAQKPKR